MNADVKATCLAALKMWRHNAIELNKAYVMDDHGKTMARIAKALAALEVDAPQGSWQPVDDDYWGYINVERKGTVLSIIKDHEFEVDNGYIIVPLPKGVRLCRRVDNPAPQVSEGMDMPDGVGWYAYDDHGLMRWVAEVTKWEVVGDTVNFCFATWEIPYDTRRTWQFKVIYPGKFYKLTMPWDDNTHSRPGAQG